MDKEYQGEERRSVSYQAFCEMREKISDQERAITTVISSHQHLVFQLEANQKTLNEISHTLKKLVDIEKDLIHGSHTMKDLAIRLDKLEKSREGDGCPALMKQNARLEKVEEFSKDIKDLKSKITWWFVTQVLLGAGVVLWEVVKVNLK